MLGNEYVLDGGATVLWFWTDLFVCKTNKYNTDKICNNKIQHTLKNDIAWST